MKYIEKKEYIVEKYSEEIPEEELEILFDNIENLYLSKTSPFDLSVQFDEENKRATSWVIRAVTKVLENDEFDITSYSENGLSYTIGEGMLCELLPCAGVGKNGVL